MKPYKVMWAASGSTLTPTQRLLLAYIALHAGDGGACWASVATLVADTGLTRNTVRSALGELVRRGVLSATTAIRSPTTYRINAAAIQRAPLGGATTALGQPLPQGGATTDPGVGQPLTGGGATIAPHSKGKATEESSGKEKTDVTAGSAVVSVPGAVEPDPIPSPIALASVPDQPATASEGGGDPSTEPALVLVADSEPEPALVEAVWSLDDAKAKAIEAVYARWLPLHPRSAKKPSAKARAQIGTALVAVLDTIREGRRTGPGHLEEAVEQLGRMADWARLAGDRAAFLRAGGHTDVESLFRPSKLDGRLLLAAEWEEAGRPAAAAPVVDDTARREAGERLWTRFLAVMGARHLPPLSDDPAEDAAAREALHEVGVSRIGQAHPSQMPAFRAEFLRLFNHRPSRQEQHRGQA